MPAILSTVVIPAFNNAALTGQCVEAVLRIGGCRVVDQPMDRLHHRVTGVGADGIGGKSHLRGLILAPHGLVPDPDAFGDADRRRPGRHVPAVLGAPAREPLVAVRGGDGLVVGDNQPYSGKHPSDYTIDHHAGTAGLPHLCLEVRQDQLGELLAPSETALAARTAYLDQVMREQLGRAEQRVTKLSADLDRPARALEAHVMQIPSRLAEPGPRPGAWARR